MKPLILIANSDCEMLNLFARYFHQRGYQVETATGGVECLWKLVDHRPAALVLDEELQWGGSDGVLARMDEADVPNTPTVLVGDPLTPLVSVCRAVVARLEKPFHLYELADKVRMATEQVVFA